MADLLTTLRTQAAARRRALGVCLLLAASVFVGGLDLPAHGYEAFRFAMFGFTAGLLGILYAFALTARGVLWRPPGWLGTVVLVYWAAATAMMFTLRGGGDFDVFNSALQFGFGFGKRFAAFMRDDSREFLQVRVQQRLETEQRLDPLSGRGTAP